MNKKRPSFQECNNPRFAKAHAALKKFLLSKEPERKGLSVAVYCGGRGHGIRIAEISYFVRTGSHIAGSSIMRCEPESGNLLMAAEDFLLTYGIKPYRPKGWNSDIDLHAESIWKLEQVLEEGLVR